MMQTPTTVLEGFPEHPYGELFPGGDATCCKKAAALLKRVKIAAGSDAKTKKRPRKQQKRKN